ncbi:MAG: methionine gamma-lyase family protein [Firmicutes bacterium]|nr:methionine gamma-lyase family protein [[Eubacterium] siraeum]MCM1486964.1 methionine gamma-lyase family protein [Bacillota bacterium]
MHVFNFDKKLTEIAEKAQDKVFDTFLRIEKNCCHNSEKVLKAFIDSGVSDMHLKGTTGYGYGDVGRDKIDEVYAKAFGAEDALVRHGFVNGTHAITTALFGLLRPGDTMLSVTGRPYDTLEQVIFAESGGSLKEFGVKYSQIDLLPNGKPDLNEIAQQASAAKMIYVQRSRGYSLRPSLSVSTIGEIVEAVRASGSKAAVVVDNCYGEFAEWVEPTSVGADLIIGSLIKNPGGGIASTGGYIAGRKDLVELCSYRLTTVGAGKEVGCSLNQNREILMGFFNAPLAVTNALKTSAFASAFFEELGFETFPKYREYKTDIICSVKLGTPERLTAFCEGIQSASPVDSNAMPEPWDMPGYNCKVIMAAGCFTNGSSIELSADAPLREPYAVWLQGGTSYYAAMAGVMNGAQRMLDKGLLTLPE